MNFLNKESYMESTTKEEELITSAVVRLNAGFLGLVAGLILGLGLFVATIWLVLKGGPNPGPHLSLLSQYFPGYSVSFLGSLVGFIYAFLFGFIGGSIVGFIYNKLAR
jgi:hypothetical protein